MKQNDITVYRPNQRHELGIIKTWIVMFKNIAGSKDMIWQLFKRDFFAAYKKSFIGVSWVFIAPVFGIVNWVFFNATGILDPGKLDVPYPVYVLIGSSCWGLFMGFFTSAKATLNAGNAFILQVNYAHEALLFKQVANQLANYTIAFSMNIVVLIAFQVVPSWKIILFPVVILPLFFLGSAIGLLVSMISIVSIDMDKIIERAMTLLIYTTPIIYTSNVPNEFIKKMIAWNPLTYLVCSARDIILFGRLYDMQGYFICTGVSLLLFMISWRLFFVSEGMIVEKMV